MTDNFPLIQKIVRVKWKQHLQDTGSIEALSELADRNTFYDKADLYWAEVYLIL